MAKSKNCGFGENYQWLINLVLQALVKLLLSIIDNNEEPKERRKTSAALRKTK